MEHARTVPDDFPTDGVELSYFLVVSDYARALAFYRDVLGATVVRELPGTYSHQLKAHSTASCSSNWAELGCCLRVFI